jgi:hypothetical protein
MVRTLLVVEHRAGGYDAGAWVREAKYSPPRTDVWLTACESRGHIPYVSHHGSNDFAPPPVLSSLKGLQGVNVLASP